MQPLIILVGPTAVGKSSVAVELADLVDGEVISADSMQVYRGMDIGTAKLKPEEMVAASGNLIPHHLIDVVDPGEPFSVALYQKMATAAIAKVAAHQKQPLLVGGTGLYVRAIIDPARIAPQPTDPVTRRRLVDEAARNRDQVYARLVAVDPITARRLHPNDVKRVVRALEVFEVTGRPLSAWHTCGVSAEPACQLKYFGLTMPRAELYARIDARVERMFASGLVTEVASLLRQGYAPGLPAMQALGYQQVVDCLEGKYDFATTVAMVKRDTRRYAKRQLTWFRQDPRIHWIQVEHREPREVAVEIAGMLGRTANMV